MRCWYVIPERNTPRNQTQETAFLVNKLYGKRSFLYSILERNRSQSSRLSTALRVGHSGVCEGHSGYYSSEPGAPAVYVLVLRTTLVRLLASPGGTASASVPGSLGQYRTWRRGRVGGSGVCTRRDVERVGPAPYLVPEELNSERLGPSYGRVVAAERQFRPVVDADEKFGGGDAKWAAFARAVSEPI
eukprot:2731107-Rhodomonas_salina.2